MARKQLGVAPSDASDIATKNYVDTTKIGSSTVTTIWTGTQSAYDAIGTKDSATLYIIIG